MGSLANVSITPAANMDVRMRRTWEGEGGVKSMVGGGHVGMRRTQEGEPLN